MCEHVRRVAVRAHIGSRELQDGEICRDCHLERVKRWPPDERFPEWFSWCAAKSPVPVGAHIEVVSYLGEVLP